MGIFLDLNEFILASKVLMELYFFTSTSPSSFHLFVSQVKHSSYRESSVSSQTFKSGSGMRMRLLVNFISFNSSFVSVPKEIFFREKRLKKK